MVSFSAIHTTSSKQKVRTTYILLCFKFYLSRESREIRYHQYSLNQPGRQRSKRFRQCDRFTFIPLLVKTQDRNDRNASFHDFRSDYTRGLMVLDESHSRFWHKWGVIDLMTLQQMTMSVEIMTHFIQWPLTQQNWIVDDWRWSICHEQVCSAPKCSYWLYNKKNDVGLDTTRIARLIWTCSLVGFDNTASGTTLTRFVQKEQWVPVYYWSYHQMGSHIHTTLDTAVDRRWCE